MEKPLYPDIDLPVEVLDLPEGERLGLARLDTAAGPDFYRVRELPGLLELHRLQDAGEVTEVRTVFLLGGKVMGCGCPDRQYRARKCRHMLLAEHVLTAALAAAARRAGVQD